MDQVKDLPGDIVECGVFKGTGMLTFLKNKAFFVPNSGKKVIGFDFFNSEKLVESLSGIDKEAIGTLFDKRNYKHEDNQAQLFGDFVKSCGFEDHEFELVAGDITKTAYDYVKEALIQDLVLYIDLDLDVCLLMKHLMLWDRVVKGGIVVFDEYAFHKWSESAGVDRFFADKDVQIKTLNYICPTAYVVKK